ncbi:MAG: hypothetical protein RI894_1588 [Bacteroidota bacterium]|jgi:peroxiredoxin
MFKKTILLVALISCSLLAKADEDKNEVVIIGTMSQATGDSIRLYEYDGILSHPIAAAALKIDAAQTGTFSIKVPKKLVRGVYFVGTDRNNVRTIMLQTVKINAPTTIVVTGKGSEFKNAQVTGSAENDAFDKAMFQMQTINGQSGQAVGEFRQAQQTNDTAKIRIAVDKMRSADAQKWALLNDLAKSDPFLRKAVGLRTYISWYYDKKGYADEIQYFANQYFQCADFSSAADFERMPLLSDSFREFVTTLMGIQLPFEMQKGFIDNALAKVPAGTRAYKAAISGVIQSYIDKEPTGFVFYGEKWLAAYRKENPELAPMIEQRLASVRSQVIGGAAPEIKMPTPEGKEFALSELKGKVVLIDFWASWCGPCRRSMPEVKATYAKYKDRGFEILGVSLDKDQSAWVGAIAADALPWKHVSDLQLWQSKAAQTYGVTSIPQTVLIDKQGNIAARNLHGPELEQKIEEVLNRK